MTTIWLPLVVHKECFKYAIDVLQVDNAIGITASEGILYVRDVDRLRAELCNKQNSIGVLVRVKDTFGNAASVHLSISVEDYDSSKACSGKPNIVCGHFSVLFCSILHVGSHFNTQYKIFSRICHNIQGQ